jgi:hypothetical protein
MKNRILATLVLLLPFGVLLFFWLHPGIIKTAPEEKRPDQAAVVANALARQDSNTVAVIESNFARVQPAPATVNSKVPIRAAGEPSTLQFTNFAPVTVLQNMSRAVRRYGEMFGGNPVGTNPEITQQLTGQNPKHLNFISAEAGLRIDGNGELVDPWGTPYFSGRWRFTPRDRTG